MRIYRDLDLVEQLGSGLPRILKSYNKTCFYFTENHIRMTLPIEQVNEQIKKTVGKTQQDILQLLIDDPKITREEIAEKLKISVRGVEYNFKKLKDNQIIDRRGGRKEGHWIVLQQFDL